MGNLRFAAAILFVAACGSDHASMPDAKMADAAKMIDAKVFMDAPPPVYDFSCYGMTPGTTVATTITLTGTVGELSQSGLSGLANMPVAAYKVGSNTAAVNGSGTSGAMGAFTLGPIVTTGTAIGSVKASDSATTPTYRTTYLYPPNPIRANFDGLPVPLVADSTVTTPPLSGILNQDDSQNGMLFVAVHDCSTGTPTPIDGATLKVQQNGQNVGDIFDIGAVIPQAAGTFFVSNVPDNTGSSTTQVSASYNGMNFPAHDVTVHKKPPGTGQIGTITVTDVPPGPIN